MAQGLVAIRSSDRTAGARTRSAAPARISRRAAPIGLGGGEESPDAGQPVDDRLAELDARRPRRPPASANVTRLSGTVASRLDCGVSSMPGDPLRDDGQSRFAVDAGDDGEMVGVGSVLDGGLGAGEPVRLHGRSRARCRPAAARLEQRDREPGRRRPGHAAKPSGELGGKRRQARSGRRRCRAAGPTRGDRRSLARPGTARSRRGRSRRRRAGRTRPGCSQSRARSASPACQAASAAGHWRSSRVLIDSSIQTCSSLSSRSTSIPWGARGFGRR